MTVGCVAHIEPAKLIRVLEFLQHLWQLLKRKKPVLVAPAQSI